MDIAMITARKGPLAAFRAGLEQRSARVECFADGWDFIRAAGGHRWNLVIVDAVSSAFPGLVEPLLEQDASLNIAVISDLAPDAFHASTEGLGLLCGLPASPTAADAGPVLDRLLAVGGLDPAVEAAQARLDAAKFNQHPHCVVCWDRHPFGLQVDYRATGANEVEGRFGCGKFYEGYQSVVHGGIVSSLLDGAMASCILAKGLEAYTVELRVRFRGAVATGKPASIRGQWLRGAGPVHLLHATLEQDGKIKATARAKFMEGKPDRPARPVPEGAALRGLLQHAHKRLV
jgi:acyl-coenzyme A thioesterase PaaI-like protein